MTIVTDAASLDLGRFLRAGDRIVIGQACGEPTTLVEALIAQGAGIGGLSAFIATSFSGLFTPDSADAFALASMGAIGALRSMSKAGKLAVIPAHVSQIGPMIAAGILGCDVALIQVSPADAQGNHSLGLIGDHVLAAVAKARVVIAEVNAKVPFVPGETLPGSAIHVAVHVSRGPVEVAAAKITETDEAIARHAAGFIGDGSVIQTGVGAVPDAILRLLGDRKDLGVHSGMLGDGLVDLVEAGVVTNARKRIDTGAGEKAFCAGGDLKEMVETGMRVPPRDMFPLPYDNIELSKPTIAAVNGVAFAGGWMIAQACDLCVASTAARFAITEVKVGRGSPWAAPLIHMIPQRIMMEIILTGKPITAQRAYEIGLVNRLAAPEALMDAAIALAQEVLEGAPLSVKAGRETVMLATEMGRGAALQAARAAHEYTYCSDDAQEGPRAFSEKRKPVWTGR